jgi:hypothetical protein
MSIAQLIMDLDNGNGFKHPHLGYLRFANFFTNLGINFKI